MENTFQEKIVPELKKNLNGLIGAENLINFLEFKTDFLTAPASTEYHGSVVGGLANHSWNVYCLLKDKAAYYKEKLGIDIPERSITICGLLHDVCKLNTYKKVKKPKKDENGRWIEVDSYAVEDRFPVGHGEKSVIILQRYISLTDEEVVAIRWHLGHSETGTHFFYPTGVSFKNAIEMSPLTTMLFSADNEATNIIERI